MGALINFVYQQLFRFFMAFVERDLIPDFVVRRGIRLMLSQRIALVSRHCNSVAINATEPATEPATQGACCTPWHFEVGIISAAKSRLPHASPLSQHVHGLLQEQKGGEQGMQERLQRFVEELKTMPVAIQTQAANEQHYEV